MKTDELYGKQEIFLARDNRYIEAVGMLLRLPYTIFYTIHRRCTTHPFFLGIGLEGSVVAASLIDACTASSEKVLSVGLVQQLYEQKGVWCLVGHTRQT